MQNLLLSLATTPTPMPTPTLRDGITEDQVTPGLLGFIMTAFFVVATALLIVDMVRRIRRVRYRAQVEEERIAAAAEADIEAEEAREEPVAPQENRDTNGNGFSQGNSLPRD
ncbi:hypothetical protein [Pseudarthrobacter chlorophenolicus]|uniref:hypothetical protein n=1 Tax=Pseudarthrobacter chlorophenolicus TaxID=85085 RepID=UPI0005F2D6AE|nr:hypothetical protein [Pseudarthrobacter chlorophenolicus]